MDYKTKQKIWNYIGIILFSFMIFFFTSVVVAGLALIHTLVPYVWVLLFPITFAVWYWWD